ncbi:hypothetical protein WR25_01651 [Diploscapter pachys]|uniref:Uncharacterized protein n=1 Tax=Diploscapter pachys TaxID=2018661 RepID=A0A2A2JS29_9BILA|nr:hypothetical protein WR25_01651 [Diploscapter pachys]
MTTAKSVSPNGPENLHKLLYDLLCALHSPRKTTEGLDDNLKEMLRQIIEVFGKKVQELEWNVNSEDQMCSFQGQWGYLTWSIISLMSRLGAGGRLTVVEKNIDEQLNTLLIALVNKTQKIATPRLRIKGYLDGYCNAFMQQYNAILSTVHSMHSHLDKAPHSIETTLTNFAESQLRPCLESFREMCNQHSNIVNTELRKAQLNRMANFVRIPDEPVAEVVRYYNYVFYILGALAARIQAFLGFRFECLHSSSFLFAQPDPIIRRLLDMIISTIEQLVSDGLFASEPLTSSILVTNNLFPFSCGCVAKAITFKHFEVQIVSEDTAAAIQAGNKSASLPGNFPSAALLAMKPTSGVKRNNATANQSGEGGNTAHKKSDVNSKEAVCLGPTFSLEHATWQASYPHLLCTTRQRDAVLLDTRAGSQQVGKRPLFYFYIKGTAFSASGGYFSVRSLSLPFAIATRRNQDCQVQRMMSSYTATCFWLYGTGKIDGLVLRWTDQPIEWRRLNELIREYFAVHGEVCRTLNDDDFILLENKLKCSECTDENMIEDSDDSTNPDRLITFKNVLCPHLRSDYATNGLRFSLWRGLLEVLQIFQEPRSSIRVLWDDFLIFGFIDIVNMTNLLMQHQSAMCIRLSLTYGGSICFTLRTPQGEIVHMEPIEAKKFQAKNIKEYVVDLAQAQNIEYLLTARQQLMRISDIVEKYKIGSDITTVKPKSSNVSHRGPVTMSNIVRYTPMRTVLVPCRQSPCSSILDSSVLDPSPLPLPSAVPFCTSIPTSPILTSSTFSSSHMQDVGPNTNGSAFILPHYSHPQQANNQHCIPSNQQLYEQEMKMQQHYDVNGIPPDNCSDFALQLSRLMKSYGKSTSEVCEMLGYPMEATPRYDIVQPYIHSQPPYEFI